MTAWRVGIAIKPEDPEHFGVEDTNEQWHYVGVGMDFNFTLNNNWRFQNGMGSKIPELEFEGRLSGTWGANLYLDYNNFYWLRFGLEGYAFTTDQITVDSATVNRGIHIFTTSNSKSIKSFSLMIKKLDREVGGESDETIILLGCTMNKVTSNYESTTSAVKCSIGGSFVDTKLTYDNLDDTLGYVETTKNAITPINWGCLQVMNVDDTAWEKIANNEKTSFSFNRSVQTIPECGERIDTAYQESGIQPIGITSTVYSRNPNQWQTRAHSGGIRDDVAVGSTSQPRNKGLQPMPNIRIASQSADTQYDCYAEFEDVVVDSWGNSYNSGTEITESPTLKARKGRIIFKTRDVATQLISPTLNSVKVVYNFQDNDISNFITYTTVGDTITLLDPKKDGSTFSKWTSGGTDYKGGQKVTIQQSMVSDGVLTFTATWTS